MTILGPVLMAALFIVPVWLAMNEEEEANILVIDDSSLFVQRMTDTENIHFHFFLNFEKNPYFIKRNRENHKTDMFHI